MKRIYQFIMLSTLSFAFLSCEKDWLERQPKNIILEEQVWNDPRQLVGILANLYDRLPTDMGLTDQDRNAIDINQERQAQWRRMADYDDAMWSGFSNEEGRNNIVTYPFDRWRIWNYSLVRDINHALENIETHGTALSAEEKTQFNAELRFLRAYNYFELVKRMGGVPLVTTQLIFNYSDDPAYLQTPRAAEAEVYDFIADELDAIKDHLGNEGSKTRANKYTALALKSRAMLYAASIAKYNNLMGGPITTPGGEVGIPADRAADYYRRSLEASEEIITSGAYSLYQNNPHPGENFYEAIVQKAGNPEVIFAWDFLTSKDKRHAFSYDNIPRSIREDNLSSSNVTPSLNLVESYEYLDGSAGELKTRTPDNSDFIYYDQVTDIFANKDGRLYGTVIYPGAAFKGLTVEMQAGVMVWNAGTNSYQTIEGSDLGSDWGGNNYPNGDGGTLTAVGGPHRSIQEVSNTGFYLRKYLDSGPGTSTRGIRSDVWWVWFRLGEIYLNAAEAAFELGLAGEAAGYLSTLRERAGFPENSVTAATIGLERIRNERRVELAFEDHRVWDLKRWRIAHEVWNGTASNPDAVVYALYPYRVVRPGDAARDGKYVFVKMVAPRFRAPRFFQMGNYYSAIDQSVINNNPKIVRNPFH
ncbi:RagB/SusD family nutrient uptake outer membrane protein [Parapedobacter sp. ISTM3]|uniref:RagB/SusD family nutrient uptake outer membrane protein n=1 Tax=Parapedobacter sp. ISTM3 TaxID=2800130 RepID=UPI001906E838|nr:RagB/SusD family nutrient uptake outer membrane protein [Parapedobacter sp. ISTM3]MBK1441356.1 RagB/SusD family nutrient uptake outer membrane protein [Parapedobacter sp. ISTM3]